VPLVEYAGALEDLYALAGKPDEARKQAEMVDMIDKMEQASGLNVNRNLAMAYADRDRKVDRAVALVEGELRGRRDIYTYDALAWALYKNKKFEEAARAKEKALELGTPEPAFYYHAGMIERALGETDQARKHLQRALELNARFDPRQAPLGRSRVEGDRTMKRFALFLFCAGALAAAGDPVGRMLDEKLTAAQRNDACFALRGNRSREAIAAMRGALSSEVVRACAARNLREAGAVDELLSALAAPEPEVRAVAARELGSFERPESDGGAGEGGARSQVCWSRPTP
jgi:tetratricopeptide (TPR) repeat protein